MSEWVRGPAGDDGLCELHLGPPGDPSTHVLSGVYRNHAEILVLQHGAALRAARTTLPQPAVEAMLARVLAAALRELARGLVPPTFRRRIRRPARPNQEQPRVP